MLASRFASRSPVLRSDSPLSDDQIRRVAPSIFAEAPHESRSQRYTYIPTATMLTELRKEGFQPFMVTQTRTRHEDRRDYTKHMIRLRHASQINARGEANEIILLNSHDGTSSYQMLARDLQTSTTDWRIRCGFPQPRWSNQIAIQPTGAASRPPLDSAYSRSKDHRLMGYWGREPVLFSVKLLQLLTFERRALREGLNKPLRSASMSSSDHG